MHAWWKHLCCTAITLGHIHVACKHWYVSSKYMQNTLAKYTHSMQIYWYVINYKHAILTCMFRNTRWSLSTEKLRTRLHASTRLELPSRIHIFTYWTFKKKAYTHAHLHGNHKSIHHLLPQHTEPSGNWSHATNTAKSRAKSNCT